MCQKSEDAVELSAGHIWARCLSAGPATQATGLASFVARFANRGLSTEPSGCQGSVAACSIRGSTQGHRIKTALLLISALLEGFVDDTLRWIGNEVYMEFLLNENGRLVRT